LSKKTLVPPIFIRYPIIKAGQSKMKQRTHLVIQYSLILKNVNVLSTVTSFKMNFFFIFHWESISKNNMSNYLAWNHALNLVVQLFLIVSMWT
jgi:hypothetical protein